MLNSLGYEAWRLSGYAVRRNREGHWTRDDNAADYPAIAPGHQISCAVILAGARHRYVWTAYHAYAPKGTRWSISLMWWCWASLDNEAIVRVSTSGIHLLQETSDALARLARWPRSPTPHDEIIESPCYLRRIQ